MTYGELAALAGRPGAARAAGTFCARCDLSPFVPTPPRRRRRRDRLVRRPRRRLQAPPARARGCRSLTSSATSSPRSRRPRRCCRLAELSALLPRRRVPGTCGTGTSTVAARPGERGGGPAGVRAAARPRRPLGDPHVPPARVRRRDALPAARRRGRGRARGAAEAGVLSPSGAPLERPPKRVVGRSCCRAAYLRGALLGAGSLSGPRDPHLELRTATRAGAELLADVAARDGLALEGGRAPDARRRLREGRTRRSATCSPLAGAGETSPCASRSTPSSPRPAPRRTVSRTPTRRTSCGRPRPRIASSRRSARSALDALPPTAARDRRAAAAPPVRVAARARRQGAAAADEGGGAPADANAREPR